MWCPSVSDLRSALRSEHRRANFTWQPAGSCLLTPPADRPEELLQSHPPRERPWPLPGRSRPRSDLWSGVPHANSAPPRGETPDSFVTRGFPLAFARGTSAADSARPLQRFGVSASREHTCAPVEFRIARAWGAKLDAWHSHAFSLAAPLPHRSRDGAFGPFSFSAPCALGRCRQRRSGCARWGAPPPPARRKTVPDPVRRLVPPGDSSVLLAAS